MDCTATWHGSSLKLSSDRDDTPTRTIDLGDHAMKSARLWLRLSPALIKGLDELAKKQHRSRQEVIQVLIRDAILKNRGIIVG